MPLLQLHTVETPCALVLHKRPPIQNTRNFSRLKKIKASTSPHAAYLLLRGLFVSLGGGGGLIVVIFNVVPSGSLYGGESHAAVIVEGTRSKHFYANLRFGKSQEKIHK